MTEWLKVHAWKACVGETLPRVRIPLSPPASLRSATGERELQALRGSRRSGHESLSLRQPKSAEFLMFLRTLRERVSLRHSPVPLPDAKDLRPNACYRAGERRIRVTQARHPSRVSDAAYESEQGRSASRNCWRPTSAETPRLLWVGSLRSGNAGCFGVIPRLLPRSSCSTLLFAPLLPRHGRGRPRRPAALIGPCDWREPSLEINRIIRDRIPASRRRPGPVH
jgi:hypothetical protein